MSLPFFYIPSYDPASARIVLDEENSRHIVGVLRIKKGEQIHLTDGNGNLLTCRITDDHKKKCGVEINAAEYTAPPAITTTIAVSLLKNTNRFEWFLEKATELGVNEIVPLICARTERQKFRADRMKNILVSAMLQSQQAWLPSLGEPISFPELIKTAPMQEKYIAHCVDGIKNSLAKDPGRKSHIILIGPEGDFTTEEIELALGKQFMPVSLGATRLRTETAAVAAAVILRMRIE